MSNIFFHKKNTAVLRAVCQGFDMPVASSFICPKVTGLWHHTRHRRTRPQDVGTPHLPVLKGMLLYLFPGAHFFSKLQKILRKSFPRSVLLWFVIYGWDQNLDKSRFSDTNKKNAPETSLLPTPSSNLERFSAPPGSSISTSMKVKR